ncbi:Acetylpolyamine amidohydrolase 2 [Burkholderia multivorans]
MLTPCFETPERAFSIVTTLRASGYTDIRAPETYGPDSYTRVHDQGYLRFLSEAWDAWSGSGRNGSALPLTWPVRGNVPAAPKSIDGLLGYYSMDTCAPITAGTWAAACSSADIALTGADYIRQGHRAAFALCRPPGHHAGKDCMGGYCYLNNAALAAQRLRDSGAQRVAILDVDYHHGNGTQHIFYDRSDVLFVSIHADTTVSYPFYSGWNDERGRGDGFGFNLNFPLPHGANWEVYEPVLRRGGNNILSHRPDALVVSLGVDTSVDDPIGRFDLRVDDYARMGEMIGKLRLPTLLVMEGGYLVEQMAHNVITVISAFLEAHG